MKQEKITPLWPHRKPNFNDLACVFHRQALPDRLPFIELFADIEIMAAVLEEKPIYAELAEREKREAQLRQRIRFYQTLGYDYVPASARIDFPRKTLAAEDTATLSRPKRNWVDESAGIISTLESFETYPWPTPEAIDYFDLVFVARHLPEGMKIIATTSGVLEWVMWLMGFTPFAMALHDQPDLVAAMFQRIGDLFVAAYETLVDLPQVGAVFLGDDMGYRSGPFIKPEHLRQYVFPQQRRLVEIAHSRRLPFLLHACGDLRVVMDDLIDEVGIDAKHSYEDTFLPVSEAKRLYGDRIAILGGIDVDMLTRSSEEEVRAYTRRVLAACMPGGGYALGTGNSVTNYIPVGNYLAMLDEGVRLGNYH